MHPDAHLFELAEPQHGILHRLDLLRAGYPESRIRSWVRRGLLIRDLPQVYRIVGHPRTPKQQVMAAVKWGGLAALAFGRCAAWLWGLDGYDRWKGMPEIVAPRALRQRNGIIVHRRAYKPADRWLVDSIPVTSAARTLFDLGSTDALENVELALEDGLRKGHVTIPRLQWELHVEMGCGKRGTRILRRLLEERPDDYRPTGSGLEVKTRRALIKAGFPSPVNQHPVRVPSGILLHPDLSYPEKKIAIEVLGYRFHMGRKIWHRDIQRRNILRRMGWLVLEVTTETLDRPSERAGFFAELGEALMTR